MVWEQLAQVLGLALLATGLIDVFLTVLHPDRDGPLTLKLNRLIWWVFVVLSSIAPRHRREPLALAGAVMLAGTILTWVTLPVVGYALIIWPSLGVDYVVPNSFAPYDLGDALYFSGVAFTTLGFGDISPLTARGEFVAVSEGIVGFVLGAAAIAFLLNVFQGIDRRDGMALRALAESGGTWSGPDIISRALRYEGMPGLQGRLEGWSIMLRGLHERLYRFQALAFYIRTRGARHEPERMWLALAELTLASNILARRPEGNGIRMSAENLEIMLTEFTRTVARHHGNRAQRARIEAAEPTAADRARLVALAAALPGPTRAGETEDADLLRLAARVGSLLDLIERITWWSRWREEPLPHAAPGSG